MTEKNFTMRLDSKTQHDLLSLVHYLGFSKSDAIRRSIGFFKKICDFEKKHGELKIVSSAGEKIFLIS